MKRAILSIIFATIVFPLLLVAGSAVKTDISVYEDEALLWKNGAYGYHIIYKNISDDESWYVLNNGDVPADFYIERAFLIWGSKQPKELEFNYTNNFAEIVFSHYEDKFSVDRTVTAEPYKINEHKGFVFDSFEDNYSYRIDITDFFDEIRNEGRFRGLMFDGKSLAGKYEVSEFYSDDNKEGAFWAIVLIYKSAFLNNSAIMVHDGIGVLDESLESVNPQDFGCEKDEVKGCTLLTDKGLFNLADLDVDSPVVTNLLVVSKEQKPHIFDIPDKDEMAACTPSENPFVWCDSGEHVFAVKVQNRGDKTIKNIAVKAEIPKYMRYIPGSTEYSIRKGCWMMVIDEDSSHPQIEKGVALKDEMDPCPIDSRYDDCKDFAVVRFRARVQDSTPKHYVIEAYAEISYDDGVPYKTNKGVPLILTYGSGCSLGQEADLTDCGGYYDCRPDVDPETNDDDYADSDNNDADINIGGDDEISQKDDADTTEDKSDRHDTDSSTVGCGCTIIRD